MLLGPGWIVLLLSITGIIVAFRRNRGGQTRLFAQMLAIYAVAIVLIYSFIPYKTPWLALNFWMPVVLLAGVGFDALWRGSPKLAPRFALLGLAGLTLGMLGGQTWKWCFVSAADERNPYAYAHTTEDIFRFSDRMRELVAEDNLRPDFKIAVVMKDAWPLPWYLRGFRNVGFWQPEEKPGRADVYITSPEAAEKLSPELKDFRPEFFGVRPGVLILLWTPKPRETP
jgi:predicted membrane-bound mannosyltransferase